jgi:hypothetical protein
MGVKESLTGVLKDREDVAGANDCTERAAARLERSVRDMANNVHRTDVSKKMRRGVRENKQISLGSTHPSSQCLPPPML